MHVTLRTAALGFVLAATLAPAAAAQAPSQPSRWAAWTGCWHLATGTGRRPVASADNQPTVCVAEVPGGARLTTTVAGQPAIEQTLLTDGAEHPVDQSGCRGTQRSEWAANGLRLFTRAELTCEGDPGPRHVSGYGLLLEDGSWLDIQAIEIAGRDSVRVRRYRHADAGVALRVRPGRRLAIDDIKEGAPRLSSAALETAVVETGAAIPLSSRTLIELAQAKVPDRVIDLMVAVAYPEKFVVERSAGTDRGWLPPLYVDDPFSFGGFGYPLWGSSLALYDFNPYFYSPYGYSYYNRYDPRFGYPGSVYVVGPGGGGGSGGGVQASPSGTARAVDGRGYTQVRPRDPVQTDEAQGSRRPASAGTSSSSSSAAPASSGGSASPSGASSGGSSGGGDGGGRTAVPR